MENKSEITISIEEYRDIHEFIEILVREFDIVTPYSPIKTTNLGGDSESYNETIYDELTNDDFIHYHVYKEEDNKVTVVLQDFETYEKMSEEMKKKYSKSEQADKEFRRNRNNS